MNKNAQERWEMKNFNVLDAVTLALFVVGLSITVFYSGTSIQETPINKVAAVAPDQTLPAGRKN